MTQYRKPANIPGTQEKLPPHDNEAEDAVIGSLLVDGDIIDGAPSVVMDWLLPNDFFGERNKWIYQACMQLYRRKEGINEITVARELAHDEKLEKVGGAAFLSHLISIVPTPFHILYYGGIVSRLAVAREFINAGGEITRKAFRISSENDIQSCLAELDQLRDYLADEVLRAMGQPNTQPIIKGGVIL